METVSFTNSTGKKVTRSYKTKKELVEDLERELRKIRIRSATMIDESGRKRLSDAACRLLVVLHNYSSPFAGQRLYDDPTIEIR